MFDVCFLSCSGYCLWPSTASLPDGSKYSYHIGNSNLKDRDLLKEFATTMNDNGLGHGFYYSLTNNFYLNVLHNVVQSNSTILPNQEDVSQEEFEAIALHQIEEIWSNYGDLTEIWFDGGYTTSMKDSVTSLLAKYQPNALAFGGFGISPNPAAWVGTETGKFSICVGVRSHRLMMGGLEFRL